MRIEDVFADLPTLETPRLKLRKMTLADVDDRFHFLSDEQVTRFLPFETHKSKAETEAGLRRYLELYATGQVSPWGIELKETGRLIGTIGYTGWLPSHGRAELFYYLAREVWGQGIAVEAARAAIQFGFDRMGLNRVEATVNPENVGSQRVMEKLGMTREGLLRESYKIKGVYLDHLIYSVLRREWNQ
jgi:ribosomal-protein-alanine N-acetyltransferase